jgi:SAM-dependent methyltransferase
MASDGRVYESPLQKMSCESCGHGFHQEPPSLEERERFYDDDYGVCLRAPVADRRRAEAYAAHIQSGLAACGFEIRPSMSVVEFGCGTGALLKLVADRWAVREAVGIEPAARLAEVARSDSGGIVEIRRSFAEGDTVDSGRHDIAVSVNVIEHSFDPVAFLAAKSRSIHDGGVVVIVCPDGNTANSELLFRDHLSSFSTASMMLAARQAGLQLVFHAALTGEQRGFQLFMLRRGEAQDVPLAPHTTLADARDGYLTGWSDIEPAALGALADRDFAIFGIGEYADFLDAYCPELASKAKFYVVDAPLENERGGRPVISLDAGDLPRGLVMLAAVNPRSWRALKDRLQDRPLELLHPYQFTSLRAEL